MNKKEVLIVSVGTGDSSRHKTIRAIEEKIESVFSSFLVRHAFTSQIAIEHIKRNDNVRIDNVKEALERAVENGVKQLVIQPTHLMKGLGYVELTKDISAYSNEFEKVVIGEPLLSNEVDFEKVIKAVTGENAQYDDGETAICLVGHGTETDANEVYVKLQKMLAKSGYTNYYIGTIFPGLKRLDLSNAMYILYEDDLNELTNLEEIGLREAPETFAGLISDKENIRSITIGDGFSIDSLKGIEEFQNLEALYIKAGQITDLSNLSSLEHLETLVIEDGSRINNFGTLASLKNLKKILIRSENLKNIDFMDEMPQLEDVAICGSAIKSIEPLRSHKGTLRQLTLLENYDVTDYSLVDEFTELEEASIGVSYDDILPTFAGMKNLKKLYVEGADDISFAGNAVNVTELTLSYSNLENLAVLNRLSNLKELHINDTKSYTKTLSPVMELTGLEVLDISGTYIFGYVEELLSLPNLQEFCMDGCHVAFDFNKLTGNENLKILSMNEAELIDYGTEYDPNEYYSSGEGTQIDVSNYAQRFQNFPNLTELYMVGTGLENIEFAKGLSKLEVLNISDNYISSVAPLKELKNLNMLWCEDNDITDLSELGEHVNIIEE